MISSSSADHASLQIEGLRWLCQRSRHCEAGRDKRGVRGERRGRGGERRWTVRSRGLKEIKPNATSARGLGTAPSRKSARTCLPMRPGMRAAMRDHRFAPSSCTSEMSMASSSTSHAPLRPSMLSVFSPSSSPPPMRPAALASLIAATAISRSAAPAAGCGVVAAVGRPAEPVGAEAAAGITSASSSGSPGSLLPACLRSRGLRCCLGCLGWLASRTLWSSEPAWRVRSADWLGSERFRPLREGLVNVSSLVVPILDNILNRPGEARTRPRHRCQCMG